MIEIITFNSKRWIVLRKIHMSQVEDRTKLKKMYNADLILSDKKQHYYVLEEILDADFTEL